MGDFKRAQSIVGTNNDGGRPKNDFYPTPPEGTIGLMNAEHFSGWKVWEPACGDGSMSKVLTEYGFDVYSSDIEPRGYGDPLSRDFLKCNYLYAPIIITNPPFRIAKEFAEHALDLGCEKLALLCKLSFLEGARRGKWLPKTPLKNVYVFSKRLTMTRNGETSKNGGMIAFAWFVWEKGYMGKPMIGWI